MICGAVSAYFVIKTTYACHTYTVHAHIYNAATGHHVTDFHT